MPAPWVAWTGAWFVACAIAPALLVMRRDPTIWRGASLLRFTIALAVVALATTIAFRAAGAGPLLVAMSALIMGAWLLRRHALISGHDANEIGCTIESSARRVNLTPEWLSDGYRLALPAGALRVTLRAIGGPLTLVSMRAVPPHRKAELFARLFEKQYRGVLPTVVIRQA